MSGNKVFDILSGLALLAFVALLLSSYLENVAINDDNNKNNNRVLLLEDNPLSDADWETYFGASKQEAQANLRRLSDQKYNKAQEEFLGRFLETAMEEADLEEEAIIPFLNFFLIIRHTPRFDAWVAENFGPEVSNFQETYNVSTPWVNILINSLDQIELCGAFVDALDTGTVDSDLCYSGGLFLGSIIERTCEGDEMAANALASRIAAGCGGMVGFIDRALDWDLPNNLTCTEACVNYNEMYCFPCN